MAEVRVERTEDGFQAVNGRGARVAIGDGDTEGAFTPVELLLAALGGCELVTVEPLTAQRGHRMARLAATVQAEKVETSKLGTITDNLARFSGEGLQNVNALVQDSRRSINRIEEAVSDFQRNPQRILSGGEGEVRQYDGRARR